MIWKAVALVYAHTAQPFGKQLGTLMLQSAKCLVKAMIPEHLIVR